MPPDGAELLLGGGQSEAGDYGVRGVEEAGWVLGQHLGALVLGDGAALGLIGKHRSGRGRGSASCLEGKLGPLVEPGRPVAPLLVACPGGSLLRPRPGRAYRRGKISE